MTVTFPFGPDEVQITEHKVVTRVRAVTEDGRVLVFDVQRGRGFNKCNTEVAFMLVGGRSSDR